MAEHGPVLLHYQSFVRIVIILLLDKIKSFLLTLESSYRESRPVQVIGQQQVMISPNTQFSIQSTML